MPELAEGNTIEIANSKTILHYKRESIYLTGGHHEVRESYHSYHIHVSNAMSYMLCSQAVKIQDPSQPTDDSFEKHLS